MSRDRNHVAARPSESSMTGIWPESAAAVMAAVLAANISSLDVASAVLSTSAVLGTCADSFSRVVAPSALEPGVTSSD